MELAHREGVLTSASLMVGEAAAADAVDRARRLPDLKVGLHVALADATPVLPPDRISMLVDRTGRFPKNMLLAGFRFYFRRDVRNQLAAEIRAQFEAFAATGLPLDHVNGHKHIQLHPTVAQLILSIGREFGLRAMRVPSEPEGPIAATSTAASFGARMIRLWSRELRRRLRLQGVKTSDQMFGLAWSGALTEGRLLSLLTELPPGTSEIYFHPATTRSAKLAEAMPDYHHEEELAALLSPAVRRLLDELRIERISYSDLAA